MSDTQLDIADTPDALTPAWLTKALEPSLDGARVTDVEATPVGTGQMCDSVRLALRYDRVTSAPATLIAKLPAGDPTSRSTALQLRSYEIEVRFYQELAPTLPVHTPAVPGVRQAPTGSACDEWVPLDRGAVAGGRGRAWIIPRASP